MTDLLDEVCAWVRGGSHVPPETVTAMSHMADDARLLAEAFTGETGRRRLMIFARMTVLRPPVNVALPAADAAAYAQMRQGQDSVFAALVRYLDIHADQQRTDDHERSIATEPRPDFGWGAARDADPGDERFTDTFDPAGSVGGR